MPFPLQHTKRDEAAREMVPLRLFRPRLTAGQTQLIRAHAEDFRDWRAAAIQAAHCRGRERQALGGVVLLAVSDHQDFETPAPPAPLGPVGVPPMVTQRVPSEPAILLQATPKIPPVGPNPLQEGLGRRPGVKEHIRGAATQAMPGLAESLSSQLVLRGASFPPQTHAKRDPERPARPHQQDEGKTIHGRMLRTGEHPRQALNRHGTRLGNDRILDEERALFPDEQRAPSAVQECVP
jgi:hypothetical protein